MDLRRLPLAGICLLVSAAAIWIVTSQGMAQQLPIPKDFSYEETKPLGAVTFSHKFHVTEKKLQCPECHIKPKLFEMKKLAAASQMKMAKLNEGQFCGACHEGKRAFSTKDAKACARCHEKK